MAAWHGRFPKLLHFLYRKPPFGWIILNRSIKRRKLVYPNQGTFLLTVFDNFIGMQDLARLVQINIAQDWSRSFIFKEPQPSNNNSRYHGFKLNWWNIVLDGFSRHSKIQSLSQYNIISPHVSAHIPTAAIITKSIISSTAITVPAAAAAATEIAANATIEPTLWKCEKVRENGNKMRYISMKSDPWFPCLGHSLAPLILSHSRPTKTTFCSTVLPSLLRNLSNVWFYRKKRPNEKNLPKKVFNWGFY